MSERQRLRFICMSVNMSYLKANVAQQRGLLSEQRGRESTGDTRAGAHGRAKMRCETLNHIEGRHVNG